MEEMPFKRNLEYYRGFARRYEYGGWSVGWNPVSQQLVYRSVGDAFNCSGMAVLDCGCGTGDWLMYLLMQGQSPRRYVGIDLVPDSIEVAKKRFSRTAVDVEWYCSEMLDMLRKLPSRGFDYAVALASFDLMEDGGAEHFAYVCNVLSQINEVTSKGFAVAVQTTKAKEKRSGEWYADLKTLLELGESYGWVYIDHTFSPHYAVMAVRKELTPWQMVGAEWYSVPDRRGK